jgi:hypothetical protein
MKLTIDLDRELLQMDRGRFGIEHPSLRRVERGCHPAGGGCGEGNYCGFLAGLTAPDGRGSIGSSQTKPLPMVAVL